MISHGGGGGRESLVPQGKYTPNSSKQSYPEIASTKIFIGKQ